MTSAAATVAAPATEPWMLPSKGRVGMLCLIVAESAVFVIFVVAYLYYLGQNLSGPLPADVLELPIFISICLLASSPTISAAVRALEHGQMAAFKRWWFATIVLGTIFLAGTMREWYLLIYEHGLTIRSNLFGTTYYSLVGLHASHLIFGLVALALVMAFSWLGYLRREHAERTHLIAMYWHFVDWVWVVVLTVVYIIGR